jgi:peptide deformylase
LFDYPSENGKTQQMDQGGLFSIIVQHELDHFEGTCAVEESVIKMKGENENENISIGE